MIFLPRQLSHSARLQLGRTILKPDALSGIAVDGELSMARAFCYSLTQHKPIVHET